MPDKTPYNFEVFQRRGGIEPRIVAALVKYRKPMTMAEIADATGQDYFAVGAALTRLYRKGVLAREMVRRDTSNRHCYAYRMADD